MSWFRVDDEFHSHRKVQALKVGPCRDAALALWLRTGSYSSQANLGGFVPGETVAEFASHPEAASELVRVRLWETCDAGYKFHDWEDYNPSGERIEEKKRLARERKARSRAKLSKAAADVSDVVNESRVTVAQCSPVTRESRGSHAPGHAVVTHRSLGDRDMGSGISDLEISRAKVVRNDTSSPMDAQYRLLGLAKTPKLERLTVEQRHVLQVVAEEAGLTLEHLQTAKPEQVNTVASAGRAESSKFPGITADDGIRMIVRKWVGDPYVRNNSVGFGHLAANVAAYMTKARPAHSVDSGQEARRRAEADELRLAIVADMARLHEGAVA